MSVEEKNNSNLSLSEKKEMEMEESHFVQVDDSPFTLVKQGDVWFIVIGNTLASDKTFDSAKEGLDYLNGEGKNSWQLLITAMMIVRDKHNELKLKDIK